MKAFITERNIIQIKDLSVPSNVSKTDFQISNNKVHSINLFQGNIQLETDEIDLSQEYEVFYNNQSCIVDVDPYLDNLYSDKPLGCHWDDEKTVFRVFAPRASQITLVLYDDHKTTSGDEHSMTMDGDGVWECEVPGQYIGKYYSYRVAGPEYDAEKFGPNAEIADPYARAVVTKNNYMHPARSVIIDTGKYDWQGDTWLNYLKKDLIIYECHLRDMTAHPSSGSDKNIAGTYKGFIQPNIKGGLEYIKSLGVNAVEFLPIQEFGDIEIPFSKLVNGMKNTWNPYEKNHWGYMTSYYFAPESSFSANHDDEYRGIHGNQVDEFKDIVKMLHKQGVAVILDVVFNHVSQYDLNCFKILDKKYYFRLDENGNYIDTSGCGNDFKTERPMSRRMIVDSIKYWMTEYHIDGFRFDLAAMIDWDTVNEIRRQALEVNPGVILIAEPWGGGHYAPFEFSQYGWAAWNDQIRNGVKGSHPEYGQSFIFGKWFDFNNLDTIQRYYNGNLAKDGGLFIQKEHAVNYLESHDNHTLGDFIRIGLGEVAANEKIKDRNKHALVSENQLKLNKLAALILFTCQGGVMIHEGQEFARSKVIAPTDVPDENVGKIDHNSYNKDNETNWINYEHAELNNGLVDYYRGLVLLRKTYPAFRDTMKSDIEFIRTNNPFSLGVYINRYKNSDKSDFLVLLNTNPNEEAVFELPAGKWTVLADHQAAGIVPIRIVNKGPIKVGASSGMILKK